MKYFIGAFILVFPVHAIDLSGKQLLDNAVKEYGAGDYSAALSDFEKLCDGLNSPGIFYNIGNCHIKMGKTGLAIAAYYSALRRDPLNPDIIHNLKYAKSLTKDKLPDEDEISGISDVLTNLVRHFSLKAHQRIFLGLYLIFMAFLIYSGIIRNDLKNRKGMGIVLGALLLLEGMALWERYGDLKLPSGVVTTAQVSVRYGPGNSETEAFVLHEGAKFDIYNNSGNWSQVRLLDGKSGWIPNDQFVIIK